MGRVRITIAVFERTRITVRPRAPQGDHMDTPRITRRLAERGMRATARDVAIGLFVGFALLPALAATRLTKQPSAEVERAELDRLVAMRDVLATEVYFAPESAGPAEARRSADSVQAFVRARSGLALDDASSHRLADLEVRTRRGELRRLTPDDLAALFAGVALERARDCSDAEIEFAAEALGNSFALGPADMYPADDRASWDAAATRARLDRDARLRSATEAKDLGAVAVDRTAVRNGVVLRANGVGTMSAERFCEQTRQFRSLLRQPQLYLSIAARVREAATVGVRKRVAELGAALPDTWGEAAERGLTPVQAFLLAYSGVSDDQLVYPTPALERAGAQTFRDAGADRDRPAAYGTGGFLFSTPLEMVFDARTVARFLDLAEERSRR
jgi:hypothetical protein